MGDPAPPLPPPSPPHRHQPLPARAIPAPSTTNGSLSLRPFQLPPPPPRLPRDFNPVVIPACVVAALSDPDPDRSLRGSPSPSSLARIQEAINAGVVPETQPELQGTRVRVTSIIVAPAAGIHGEAAFNAGKRPCDEGTSRPLLPPGAPSVTAARLQDQHQGAPLETGWTRMGSSRGLPRLRLPSPRPAPRARLQIPLHLHGKCLRCFSPLHRIRDCTEEVRCNGCFRSGHLVRGCPNRGRPPAPARPAPPPPARPRQPAAAPPGPLDRSFRDALMARRTGDSQLRAGDPQLRPAMGRVVAPATPDMEVQADALASCCVLITLGGSRRRSVSTAAVADAIHKEFNIPLHLVTVVRHVPEDFLAKFIHPHHRDDVIARGNFERDNLLLNPKAWIMEAQAEHQEMKHHVQLSLEGIPLHAWSEDTIGRVIGVDSELDYGLPRSARKEDARTLDIWAWTTNPSCIPKVMQLSLPARRSQRRGRGRRRLRYRVLVHLGLHEDYTNVNEDDPRATADVFEFTWWHRVVDGDRAPAGAQEEPRDERIHRRREDDDEDNSRRGRENGRDGRSSRWPGRSRSRVAREHGEDRRGRDDRDGRDGHGRRHAVDASSSPSPPRSPRGGSSRCIHPLDAARSTSPTSTLPVLPSPVTMPAAVATPEGPLVTQQEGPATPTHPPGFRSPAPPPPPLQNSGLPEAAESTPLHVPAQPASCTTTPTRQVEGLEVLFRQPVAALLPAPQPPPREKANRRKTLAGVAINRAAAAGFSIQRTISGPRKHQPATPVSVEAEKLVCRSLGIVQNGKDITKEALDELGRRFEHEMSPAVLLALRALFRLDDADATAVEEALLSRGGQASLDHATAEATTGA